MRYERMFYRGLCLRSQSGLIKRWGVNISAGRVDTLSVSYQSPFFFFEMKHMQTPLKLAAYISRKTHRRTHRDTNRLM